ncbi:MAG TPA: sugar phosphate isomerase/epimerase family protein [Cellulomonas sp.]
MSTSASTRGTSSRPVTLFTGQWADLPFEQVARLAGGWGFDGLEIACSGDHLDVYRAAEDDTYLAEKQTVLAEHGLRVHAISNHLTGQLVCDDPIDHRHRALVSDRVWGDGDPEGVRRRAADELKVTAVAAARLGASVVTGFTGSAVWKYVAMFPPVSEADVQAGYDDFAERWHPIIDAFDAEGVRFALEVHPSEIAYDYWTAARTLAAIDHRPGFGLNFDPSHMLWQDLDPSSFLVDFADRIYHVHCKDAKRRLVNGRNGRLASHLPWGDPRRGWDFVSVGRGDVDWESLLRTIERIGYTGPLSVEWEDAGMDRLVGAPQALAFVRANHFDPPAAAFDSAFSNH